MACTPNSTPATAFATGSTLKSEIARIGIPETYEKDKANLVKDNSTFAINLYKQLKEQEGNLLYSPYSLSKAMAMIFAGATENTEKQIAETLNFSLPQDRLHPAFNWLDNTLDERGEEAKGKGGEEYRLTIINAIWGQKNYEYKQLFLDTLAQNYGAGLRILDFIHESEKSRTTINEWISEQTENRIGELVSKNDIDESTRLVLTNAVYFNAAWDITFDKATIKNSPFHLLDSSNISVPTMFQNNSLYYTESNEYQAVELPYDNKELSMVVIMPAEGLFRSFENSLSYSKVAGIIDRLDERSVIIKMPKFEFESHISLTSVLSAMGMPDAFSKEKADFSGITSNDALLIDQIIHKTSIAVDEEGTKAVAVTTISVEAVSPLFIKKGPTEMIVDRPFIFLIRDIETGTIIFIGRVVNPLQEQKLDR